MITTLRSMIHTRDDGELCQCTECKALRQAITNELAWQRHKQIIRAAYSLMENARPLVLLLEGLKDANKELNT